MNILYLLGCFCITVIQLELLLEAFDVSQSIQVMQLKHELMHHSHYTNNFFFFFNIRNKLVLERIGVQGEVDEHQHF